MKSGLSLRWALAANAVFSTSSALLMIVWPIRVGSWLGIDAPWMLRLVGVGLLVFAAELAYQVTRRRMVTWRALLASAADFSWVLGSIVLVIAVPHLMSPAGKDLVLIVAGIVFSLGVWQLWAIAWAHRAVVPGEYRHCIVMEANVSADKLWPIVANLAELKNYAPSLKRSVVLDGKSLSVGAVRACEDQSGNCWSEECIAYTAGRSFVVRFRSEEPAFPFPVRTMRGGWEVIPQAGASQVMVWWELRPKSRLLAPLILAALGFQADRDFPKIIDRMVRAAIGESDFGRARFPQRGRGVMARLLPYPC